MNRQENQRVALTKRLLKEQLTTLLQKKSIQKITVVELCQGPVSIEAPFIRITAAWQMF